MEMALEVFDRCVAFVLNCPQDRHHLRVPQHLCQLSIFPNGGLHHGRFPSLAALTFVLAILYSYMYTVLSAPHQRRSARRCATVSVCGRRASAPSRMSARTDAARAARSAPGSAAPTWASPKRARVSAERSS